MHQLEIKVLDIVDARCNHEVQSTHSFATVLVTRIVPHFERVNLSHVYHLLLALFASRYRVSFEASLS